MVASRNGHRAGKMRRYEKKGRMSPSLDKPDIEQTIKETDKQNQEKKMEERLQKIIARAGLLRAACGAADPQRTGEGERARGAGAGNEGGRGQRPD